MELGAFSISLNVKDINVSRIFYEKLGFIVFAGDINHGYLIMKQNDAIIGLFQGIIKDNILTFNPGWNQDANAVNPFDDIRIIKKELEQSDIIVINDGIQQQSGPGHFIIEDPDGNKILIDQHR